MASRDAYIDAALSILNGNEPGAIPPPSNTTDELAVAIIKTLTGETVTPPRASSNIDRFLRAILDVLQGNEPTDVPARSWNIEKYLYAILEALREHDNLPPIPSPSWLHETNLANILDVIAARNLLPSGYKRVLGFSCDNNAMWEIPDFYIKGTDTLRVSCSITATSNLIGSYSGSTSGPNYSIYASTSNVNYLRYYNTNYNSQFDADTRYDIVMTPTGTHGMKKDSDWETVDFTTTRPFCIGTTATNITTSAKLKGCLYGNIIVDGRLHLVPCERLSDHVLGYYDTISKTFFEPYEGFDGAVSLGYA